jgi:hypothetical protein
MAPRVRSWLRCLLSTALVAGATGCSSSSDDLSTAVSQLTDYSEPPVEATAATATKTSPVEAVAETTSPSESTASHSEPTDRANESNVRSTVGPRKVSVAKPVVLDYGDDVPQVMLTDRQARTCRTLVGDAFPALEATDAKGTKFALDALSGDKATVVLFWAPDRWMSRAALSDLAKDVAAKFAARDVTVACIAVGRSAVANAAEAAAKVGADLPQYLDAEGDSFAKVGGPSLPRIYVLDPAGKVAWFDIEYSEATRRELAATLGVLTKPSK